MRAFSLFLAALTITLVGIGQQRPTNLPATKDDSLGLGVILSSNLTNHLSDVTVGNSFSQSNEHFEFNQFGSRTPGYYVHFKVSVLAGKNESGDAYNASFQLSNGMQFADGFSLGVGLGIEELGAPVIPLYADIKYNYLPGRVSPFLFVRAGYGFALQVEADDYYDSNNLNSPVGGFMFNGGIGMALFSFQRTAITVGLGYRYQKVTIPVYNYWWSSYSREVETKFNRIEILFGFIFR